MLKLQVVYLTLCAMSQAAYISRMATLNRLRSPAVFRPGINLQGVHRQWQYPRLAQAASNRAPYVLYRNPPQHRYAIKHYTTGINRNVFPNSWKSTPRHPMNPVTPEYEFLKAASAPPLLHTDGGTGAIHTIPAPNLSLSEKPIIVIDASESNVGNSATSESPKPSYEVTEKYPDQSFFQMAKVEQPVGFSKATSLSSPELQSLVRNNAALQLASELGVPAISVPQSQISPMIPQQFSMQNFNGLPTQHELLHSGAEGIIIPPNALYQPDPNFLQKLQAQLLQRFPSVEFIPYATDLQPQAQIQVQSHVQIPQAQPQQNHLFLLQNEHIIKHTPQSFSPSETHKNVVKKETQESSVVTLVPQPFKVSNVTENEVEVTSASQPQNVTVELVAANPQSDTTTVKYVMETNTEEQKTTPIYYAQVGQSVGNLVANGFYSAINDVRAAAALAQVEKPQEPTITHVENFTTTLNPELQAYFVQTPENSVLNQSVTEVKPLPGVPFAKKADSVNVAYTLYRADDKDPKVTQNGAVYAGQIVEATISEDQEFNKEKSTLLLRRPPIRLFAVADKEAAVTSTIPPKATVVKAKIPPKSKLTFDDKTGEPVLRIYASYVDNPIQKELLTAKLANMRNNEVGVTRKQDTVENWKSETVKSADKTQGVNANQVMRFGIKLRSRSDDYVPLFEEYEE